MRIGILFIVGALALVSSAELFKAETAKQCLSCWNDDEQKICASNGEAFCGAQDDDEGVCRCSKGQLEELRFCDSTMMCGEERVLTPGTEYEEKREWKDSVCVYKFTGEFKNNYF